MAVERIVTVEVKRTIYVADCPKCGERDVKESNPPRERMCKCGDWVPYQEQSYTGPDFKS